MTDKILTKQRGFIDIPDGFFEALFALAAVGAISLVCAAGWVLWWAIQHVRFV